MLTAWPFSVVDEDDDALAETTVVMIEPIPKRRINSANTT